MLLFQFRKTLKFYSVPENMFRSDITRGVSFKYDYIQKLNFERSSWTWIPAWTLFVSHSSSFSMFSCCSETNTDICKFEKQDLFPNAVVSGKSSY